jgi:hypothetical protein
VTTIKPPAANPCGTCPYRRDVPSGVWHPDEYAKLPAYDRDTPAQPSGIFLCHQVNGHVCGGWAACHDMTHSLALRVAEMSGHITPETADAVADYTTPVPIFATGREAAAHGLADTAAPSSDAERAINKLTTRRARRTAQDGDPR